MATLIVFCFYTTFKVYCNVTEINEDKFNLQKKELYSLSTFSPYIWSLLSAYKNVNFYPFIFVFVPWNILY